ncbi:hypothetical protein DFH06DRAFT_1214208 [Mycena polygramma]|nr:hypothetical protein DFH06DRAFT_1214208 [Mycena polygramma]
MDSYEPSSTTSGTVFVVLAWIVCWTAIDLIIDWALSLNAFFTPFLAILLPVVDSLASLAVSLIVLGLVLLLLRLHRVPAEYKTDDAHEGPPCELQKDLVVVMGYLGMSVVFCMWTSLVSVSVSVHSSLNTPSLFKSPCSSVDPDGDDDEGNTTLVADDNQGQGLDKENCARNSSPSPPPAYYTISPSTSITIEPFELSHSTCADSPLYLLSETITDTDFDLDFNLDFRLDLDFNFDLSPSTDLAPEPALDLSVVVYVPSPLSTARVPAQDLAPAADDLDLNLAQPAVSSDEPSPIAPDAIDLSVVVFVPSPLSTAPVPVQDLAPAADDLDLDLVQPAVSSDELSPIAPKPALDLSVVVFVPSPFSTATVPPQDAVSAPAADDLDFELSEPVSSDLATIAPKELDPSIVSFVPSTTTLLVQEPVLAPTADHLDLGLSQRTSSNLAAIASKELDPSVPIFVPSPLTAAVFVPDAVLVPTADDLDLDLGQPKVLNPTVAVFVPSFRSATTPLSQDSALHPVVHSKKDCEPPRAVSSPWTGGPTRITAPRPATLTASVPEFVPRIVPGTTIPSPFAGEVHYQLTPNRSAAPKYWSVRSRAGGPVSIVSPSPSTA